jgi:hypothetical protein
MTRVFTILILAVLAGCSQEPEHKRGDLTPYFQWTQGTPVVVHLATTRPNGELIKGAVARGTLVKVTPDEIRISTGAPNTTGFDKDLVLWVEKDTKK